MYKFDLDEYKKNPYREIQTTMGEKVRILCTDSSYEEYPVVALIGSGDTETIIRYDKDGNPKDYTIASGYDLYFRPMKRTGWVNMYYDQNAITHSQTRYVLGRNVFWTESDAICRKDLDKMACSYIGAFEITFED